MRAKGGARLSPSPPVPSGRSGPLEPISKGHLLANKGGEGGGGLKRVRAGGGVGVGAGQGFYPSSTVTTSFSLNCTFCLPTVAPAKARRRAAARLTNVWRLAIISPLMEVHKRVPRAHAHPEQRVKRLYPEQAPYVYVHEECQRRQPFRRQCRKFKCKLSKEWTFSVFGFPPFYASRGLKESPFVVL